MDNTPLFQNMDEQERIYAPESVPGSHLPAHEVDADGSADTSRGMEPPSAAPVANVGSGQATQGAAAPPNLGHDDQGGGPGDPAPDAGYPMGDDDPR